MLGCSQVESGTEGMRLKGENRTAGIMFRRPYSCIVQGVLHGKHRTGSSVEPPE